MIPVLNPLSMNGPGGTSGSKCHLLFTSAEMEKILANIA
jgi:hypothetical protein